MEHKKVNSHNEIIIYPIMEELKSCPFCGVKPVIQKTKVRTYSCNGGYCHIRPSVEGYDDKHAIFLWNKRK
jgi:hypothetical protein